MSEDKDIQAFCPSCGGNSMPEDTCTVCGFSLGSVLKCPYRKDNSICDKTDTSCSLSNNNLDWETCSERID